MKLLITESQFDSVFLGKKVMVYYNLHKHTFSVKYDDKVILHSDYVKLGDVEFRVRQGGKEKDSEVKSRLKRALDYIEKRKEMSKKKTERLRKLKEFEGDSNPLNLPHIDTWHDGQYKAQDGKTEEAIKLMTKAADEAEKYAKENQDGGVAGEAGYYRGTIAWLKKDYTTVEKYINDKYVKITGNDEVLKRLLKNKDKSYKEAYSLKEMVTATEVICDNCGWEWKKADGGDDLYICHKCGHDNNPALNESLKETWKPEESFVSLSKYMIDNGMNIKPLPKIKVISDDKDNASNLLGKTAYYNPTYKSITLYTMDRHPKDILHSDYVKLGDVEFRVRQGGKEKVRIEKSKNVHAFVIGKLLDYCEYPCDNIPNPSSDEIVTYNPYKYDTFVYKSTEEPVFNAKEVEMINSQNKIFVTKR